MEEQVLSVEQMQELIDIGIDVSKASMCWIVCSDGYTVYPYNKTFRKCFEEHLDTIPMVLIPTFTLQDILEILPENITTDCGVFKQVKFSLQIHYGLLEYSTPKLGLHTEIVSKKETSSLLQAAFNMLKWCTQNKYI